MASEQIVAGTAEASAQVETEHSHGYGIYLTTWIWLLVFTVIEVGATLMSLPRPVLVVSLLILTVMKASLIFANFMHLRWERLNMLYVAITPLVMGTVLFFGVVSDFS